MVVIVMRQRLGKFLFAVARSSIGGLIVGWAFAHLSFAIPVQRIRETDKLIAFYHPKPSHPVHILIVPKKAIRSMQDISDQDSTFLVELFQVVKSIVAELALEARGYRVIVNGGEYQDVAQLHFHLISED